jgi:hypothetical protein
MLSDNITTSPGSRRAQSVHRHALDCPDRTTDRQLASADVILTLLHTVARESEAVHAISRALFVARATGRTIEHTMATRQLSHSCNLLMSRIAALQNLVIEFDEDIAGVEAGSLAELGVRAQTLAILLLLDELCDAMSYRPAAYQELFTGQLQTIEDVVLRLFDSLARINKLWLRHRAKPHALATGFTSRVFDTPRSLLYCTAIRRAQRAIADLGSDPDLAHFLRAGSSRTDAPRVGRACDQLAEVLGVALTREPDPALFLAAAVLEPEELHDLTDDDDTTS